MDFADEAISVFGGSGFGDKLDMLTATGDTSEDGSDLGVPAYLRIFCVLKPASEVATDILPKRASNEDTLTLRFANGLSFLAGGLSFN